MSNEVSIGRAVLEHSSQEKPVAQEFCARCCVARQVRNVAAREIVSFPPDSYALSWMSLIIMT